MVLARGQRVYKRVYKTKLPRHGLYAKGEGK